MLATARIWVSNWQVRNQVGVEMTTTIGDRIAVTHTDQAPREATVVDIRDHEAAAPTLLVEWADNGHRQLIVVDSADAIRKVDDFS